MCSFSITLELMFVVFNGSVAGWSHSYNIEFANVDQSEDSMIPFSKDELRLTTNLTEKSIPCVLAK